MHSKESESGVPGVEGVSLSEVHIRLDRGESASSHRRLPDSMFGRLTGLKLDARIAIGDKLRRVVYFRVGEGETTGENLGVLVGELANPATSVRSSQDWPICMAVCISLSCATSRVLLTSAHSSARSWFTRGAIRAHELVTLIGEVTVPKVPLCLRVRVRLLFENMLKIDVFLGATLVVGDVAAVVAASFINGALLHLFNMLGASTSIILMPPFVH